MEIEILIPLVTCGEQGAVRAYERGEVVAWDREDAQRLIKARYARPATRKEK